MKSLIVSINHYEITTWITYAACGVILATASTMAQTAEPTSSVLALGLVLHQKYANFDNIAGYDSNTLFTDPRFPNNPDRKDILLSWEYPANGIYRDALADPAREYYDTIEGYFIPPTSGNYVFFIAFADRCWAYLSTDDSPANKHLIIYTEGWSDPRHWLTSHDYDPDQARSDRYRGTQWPNGNTITLQANQRYYMMLLHYDPWWAGGDWFAATYKLEGESDPSNGEAPRLTGSVVEYNFDPTGASVSFTGQPQSASVLAGDKATFTTAATVTSAYANAAPLYQWQSAPQGSLNWTDIPGATAASYQTPVTTFADHGTQFRVVASLPFYSTANSTGIGRVTSDPAVLTVLPSQLLFADTFDVSAGGTRLNIEYDAGRQSGRLAPISYLDDSDINGLADALLLNTPDAPGKLRVKSYRVSPNHNFIEANLFSVEFDINVGFNDDVSPFGDYWAGIVLGTRAPNAFVISEDGLGVLFRNGGARYAVFDGATPVVYDIPIDGFPNGLPGGEFHVRLDVSTADFQGSPATIAMFINGTQVRVNNGPNNEYVKSSGFTGNFITLLGFCDPSLSPIRLHSFDNLAVNGYAVPDTTPPTIVCPDLLVLCGLDPLVPAFYPRPTVSDNVDPSPRVTYSIPSGSGFPIGTTIVTATATDASGNSTSTTFHVTRPALAFSGFLAPIGGVDATGGSFASPVRTFKLGSTIPVKFTAACGEAPVTTGLHRLHVVKYTDATTSGEPIDAVPQGTATIGDQFRLSDGQWVFNLDTTACGMSVGTWMIGVTMSDASEHAAWIQLK